MRILSTFKDSPCIVCVCPTKNELAGISGLNCDVAPFNHTQKNSTITGLQDECTAEFSNIVPPGLRNDHFCNLKPVWSHFREGQVSTDLETALHQWLLKTRNKSSLDSPDLLLSLNPTLPPSLSFIHSHSFFRPPSLSPNYIVTITTP